jgi:hypothetical protein
MRYTNPPAHYFDEVYPERCRRHISRGVSGWWLISLGMLGSAQAVVMKATSAPPDSAPIREERWVDMLSPPLLVRRGGLG